MSNFSSLAIHRLGLLFMLCCQTLVFAQSESKPSDSPSVQTELIYQRLDAYLEQADAVSTLAFSQWLSSTQTTTKDQALAKVISLCQLGYHTRSTGQLTQAIRYYTQAWYLYREFDVDDFDILESCLKPLGNLYTQTNAFAQALQTHQLYLNLAQKTNDGVAIAGGIANLAKVYQHFGNPEKAIEVLQSGVRDYPKNHYLLTNLASSLISIGRVDEGLTVAASSIAEEPDQPEVYILQAEVLRQIQAYDQACDALEYALLLASQQPNITGRALAKIHLNMASIRYQQQKYDMAISQIRKAYEQLLPQNNTKNEPAILIPDQSELFAENTLMDVLDVHAQIALATAKEYDAMILYERATAVSLLLGKALQNEFSQFALQTAQKNRAEAFLAIAYKAYREGSDPSLIGRAFSMSQSTQALLATQSYIDKKRRQSLHDQPLVTSLYALEKKQALWQEQLYLLQESDDMTSAGYTAILDSLELNRFKMQQLQATLQAKYPLPETDQTNMLDTLQIKARTQQHRLLSYFLGKQASYQFSIDADTIAFSRLTDQGYAQQDFLRTLTDYIHFFEDANRINQNPKAYTQAAYDVFRALQIPTDMPLVVLPDSFLQFIPFEALLTEGNTGFQFQMMPWLGQKVPISYAVSARVYLSPDAPLSKTATALGVFPVFENTGRALPFSLDEATSLDRYFPSDLLLKDKATAVAAFAKANTHHILHLSTHASGGSFTTPAALSFYDTILPVSKLAGNSWETELVVLSACETGIGAIVSGEGAQSLARGFQYAGIKNMVFSLWQVNDQATTTLMSNFYNSLKKSRSRNLSLFEAKKAYLNDTEIPNAKKSPYYWAAFVYYGTTDPVKTNNFWIWAVGLGLILVFLVLWIQRKYGITSRIFTR